MKCNNCGQDIPEGSKFCNNCGATIEVNNYQFNQQSSNESTSVEPVKNKKHNLVIIILLIILISSVVINGGFFIMKGFINDNSSKNQDKGNRTGKVELVKNDGDYKQYSLSIVKFDWTGKYDFKVGNHTITMELVKAEDESEIVKMYVDNNYIFDDLYLDEEKEKLFSTGISIDTLGDYIIFDNHDGTSRKSFFMYIVDKDGENAKKIYELDSNGIIMYDWTIDKTGITVNGDIAGEVFGYVNLPIDSDISLCEKNEWPEGFNEQSPYSKIYKYEYNNGNLDLNGKLMSSMTVEEAINDYESTSESTLCQVE